MYNLELKVTLQNFVRPLGTVKRWGGTLFPCRRYNPSDLYRNHGTIAAQYSLNHITNLDLFVYPTSNSPSFILSATSAVSATSRSCVLLKFRIVWSCFVLCHHMSYNFSIDHYIQLFLTYRVVRIQFIFTLSRIRFIVLILYPIQWFFEYIRVKNLLITINMCEFNVSR